MKQIFFEKEVANLISMVGDMIVNPDSKVYEHYYKYICDDKTLSNDLASHIIAVVNGCRKPTMDRECPYSNISCNHSMCNPETCEELSTWMDYAKDLNLL